MDRVITPDDFSVEAIDIAMDNAMNDRREAVMLLKLKNTLRDAFEDSDELVLSQTICDHLSDEELEYTEGELLLRRHGDDDYQVVRPGEEDATTLFRINFPESDLQQVPYMRSVPRYRYIPVIDTSQFRPRIERFVDEEAEDYSVLLPDGNIKNITRTRQKPHLVHPLLANQILSELQKQCGIEWETHDFMPVLDVEFSDYEGFPNDDTGAIFNIWPNKLGGLAYRSVLGPERVLRDLHTHVNALATTGIQRRVVVNRVDKGGGTRDYHLSIIEDGAAQDSLQIPEIPPGAITQYAFSDALDGIDAILEHQDAIEAHFRGVWILETGRLNRATRFIEQLLSGQHYGIIMRELGLDPKNDQHRLTFLREGIELYPDEEIPERIERWMREHLERDEYDNQENPLGT